MSAPATAPLALRATRQRRFAPRGLWTLPGLPGPLTAQTHAPPTAPWVAANGRRPPQALGNPANAAGFPQRPQGRRARVSFREHYPPRPVA